MHNPLKTLTILCTLAALCGCDSNNGSADRGDPPAQTAALPPRMGR